VVSLRGIAPDTLKLGTALRPLRVERAAVDVGCAKSEACGENRSRQNENFSDIYFYFISPRAWSLESKKTRLSVQMKIGEICCKKFSERRHWCWRTPESADSREIFRNANGCRIEAAVFLRHKNKPPDMAI